MTERFAGQGFTIMLYGDTGSGKTPVSATGPRPLLFLDVESRARFLRGRKIRWNPLLDQPPKDDGTWDICVVNARDWSTVRAAVDYIIAGATDFRSVTLDSVTEAQKRSKDNVKARYSNDDQMSERLWGILLEDMELAVRQLRDATTHPTRPLELVTITALPNDAKLPIRPLLQGKLGSTIVAYVDVLGWLFVEPPEDGVPGPSDRRLLVGPSANYMTKDASSNLESGGIIGKYGSIIPGPISLTELVDAATE